MSAATLIFDLDGTLVDSAPAILECVGQALREAQLTPAVPLEVGLIGPPLKELLKLVTGRHDEAQLRELTARFTELYDDAGVARTRPYPGVEEALELLRVSGARLHLATNKRWRPTAALLEALRWTSTFTSTWATDKPPGPFPHKAAMLARLLADQRVDARAAVYVGDTLGDAEASAANGLAFAYAEWGYGGAALLAAHPGWRRLPGPEAIRTLL